MAVTSTVRTYTDRTDTVRSFVRTNAAHRYLTSTQSHPERSFTMPTPRRGSLTALLTAAALLTSAALGQVALNNAERAAQNYLSFTAFSESGLVEQLVYEGFSESTARQAVRNLNVDWREQAVKSAAAYVEISAFSRDGLVDQLVFEGFSRSDAQHGADRALSAGGRDGGWQAQAFKQAEQYLAVSAFSREGLIDQLVFSGFTRDQAEAGVNALNVDWFEQAAAQARSYLDISAFSRSGLIDQLMFSGFTREQATYGVDQVGF